MAKSKQRSAKRPKGPVAQGRKPKGVLSTKSTNKTDSSNNAKVSEPTTPFDESFPSTVLTSENWPAAYLGNGDVLVDAIRSAASEMEKMHHPSDIESFELDADNQFHHYDVLDELLCEQVDPSLSVVPTPNSKATSNLPAKTASTSLEWDPVNSSTTIKWPLRVFEQNSWLEGIMSKISAFFSQTTFRLEANVSHWSGKLQYASFTCKTSTTKNHLLTQREPCLTIHEPKHNVFVFLWIGTRSLQQNSYKRCH
ncbi:LAQU0S02e00606g1_1 [Lachancea quebecensis]|uniref:LAQU0S02e00606g1_1 n=1 Tax=Lachancea quebecensis TaxID=1654605 RepID=A0A0P1KMZ8_9SACH|nr:LAQU0S02e00606g1_1 [Lachancea quebecensis]